MSPVRNAPELSHETRVDEEQRWVSRGHAQAVLEIRRILPDLRDGSRESFVARICLPHVVLSKQSVRSVHTPSIPLVVSPLQTNVGGGGGDRFFFLLQMGLSA